MYTRGSYTRGGRVRDLHTHTHTYVAPCTRTVRYKFVYLIAVFFFPPTFSAPGVYPCVTRGKIVSPLPPPGDGPTVPCPGYGRGGG